MGNLGGTSRRLAALLLAAFALLVPTLAIAGGGDSQDVAGRASQPREVRSGVEIDLADGDRFRVTTSRNLRTVWGQLYDAATSSWGQRTVVYKEADVYCGDVDARAAGTSVAVIAECDQGGYAEDQAPTYSQALFSTDLTTWAHSTLPGEAYEEPGISPDGRSAVWPAGEGYVRFTVESGFSSHALPTPGSEYTRTAVVTDDELVTLAYGAPGTNEGDACHLAFVSQRGEEAVVRQELPAKYACSDVDLTNDDALTIRLDAGDPAYTTVASRPDQSSVWAITTVAPVEAPGLLFEDDDTLTTPPDYLDQPGLPLAVVGSRDKRTWQAQTYDQSAQRWLEPVTLFTAPRRCRVDGFEGRLTVLASSVRCGRVVHLVASQDGTRWWHGAGRTSVMSPDRSQLAVSTKRRTHVYSAASGPTRVDAGTAGGCGLVIPVGTHKLIRLTPNERGWPERVERLRNGQWQQTRVFVPRVPPKGRCKRVQLHDYGRVPSYDFMGDRQYQVVRVRLVDGRWKLTR